ncbi:hypothetical protein KQX54_020159 [Cotesia glomerata]|uniref:Secreted protein n=1 Tax=Cotesia glomerata TaxID=32391 RepID=A0AAV7HZP6_COTGL|nr:hypothetical protein KQX54_020159 [Cotesia glomerata]
MLDAWVFQVVLLWRRVHTILGVSSASACTAYSADTVKRDYFPLTPCQDAILIIPRDNSPTSAGSTRGERALEQAVGQCAPPPRQPLRSGGSNV